MRLIWTKLDKENNLGASFSHRVYLSHTAKTIGAGVIICLILFGILHASQPMGLPMNVCSDPFCDPVQREIWNRFQNATGLKLVLVPSVYSGVCYHDSPSYNPHIPQFGGVLIDKSDGQVFFQGRFSFYKQTNPYANLSIKAARKRFPEQYEVILYDLFAYADPSDTQAPFCYWFRQEENTNDLLLVGYFGWNHTILCALDRH